MSLFEYDMLSQALKVRKENELTNLYLQSWLNREVEMQVEVGRGKNKKYEWKYQSFDNFRNGIEGKPISKPKVITSNTKLVSLIKTANNERRN